MKNIKLISGLYPKFSILILILTMFTYTSVDGQLKVINLSTNGTPNVNTDYCTSFSFGGNYYTLERGNMKILNMSNLQYIDTSTYPTQYNYSIVAESDGNNVYMGLGFDNNTLDESNEWYKYDPTINSYTQMANFPGGVRSHAVSFYLNGYIYVGGGESMAGPSYSDFYQYDIAGDSWNQIDDFPYNIYDGISFVIGSNAYVGLGMNGQWTNNMYRLNGTSWTQISSYPGTAPSEPIACSINNLGVVLVKPYYPGKSATYNPISNTWSYNGISDYYYSPSTINDSDAIFINGSYSQSFVKIAKCSPPILNAGEDVSACNLNLLPDFNASVSGGLAPYTYRWIPNTVSDTTIRNPKALAVGEYSVIVKDSSGCSISDNVKASLSNVHFNFKLLGSQSTVTSISLCNPSSAIIMVSPDSGYAPFQYSWSVKGNYNDSTNSYISVSPTVNTTYTVTVKDKNQCSSTNSIPYNVNNFHISISASSTSICIGSSVNLTSSYTGATGTVTYQWKTGSATGTTFSTSSNVTVSPTSSTTYYLVASDGSCPHSAYVTIYVHQTIAEASWRSNLSFCDTNHRADLLATVTQGSAPFTYSWSNSSYLDFSTIANPAANKKSTTYTVTVTDAYGCSDTGNVTLPSNARYGNQFTVNENLSIQEPSSDGFSIYPNPTSRDFNIEIPSSNDQSQTSVVILNSLGEIVYSIIIDENTTLAKIPTDSFSTGIYFVNLQKGNFKEIKKLVIAY